ncbi:MAG: hypothetical protein ACRDOL_41045 [Streptosporangiaceae bacterium]
MPEPAVPLPYPDTDPDGLIPDGTVPPMPSEVTNARMRAQRPAAAGRWRKAMMLPRKMMGRTPRGAP